MPIIQNERSSFQSIVSALTPTSEHHTLYPLPPEIRHMIYASAYAPNTRSRCTSIALNLANPSHWLPSICSLNRATYIDAGLWYISAACFNIPLPSASQSLKQFSRFLSTFPGSSGFDAVRRLEVEYFDLDLRRHDRVQRAALWKFLGECGRLRELTLQFRVMNLLEANVSCYDVVMSDLRQEDVDGMSHLRSLKDVVEACGVDRLFEVELGELRTMYLEVWPTTLAEGVEEVTGRSAVVLMAMPLIEELVGYLREGFVARGREVEIVIQDLFASGMRRRES
ncbi:uncharacterized protein CC84DRAFT_1169927, partial [Paraphaeosphaeria sporulosa]